MPTPPLSPAAAVIHDLVTRQQVGTSLVEICGALRAAGHDVDGDLALEHPGFTNIYLWAGVSQTVVDALNELLTARLVHYVPTSVLVYAADGGMLNLPLAKSARNYKTPRWAPVVINAGPAPA